MGILSVRQHNKLSITKHNTKRHRRRFTFLFTFTVRCIKVVFTPSKIKSWLGFKDPIPVGLRSRATYKFSCTGCSACYVGETNKNVAICEHLSSDRHSHIFKHLRGSEIVARFVQKIVLKFWTLLPQASN